MKRLDYNFSEYRNAFNNIARKIISESIDETYDAEQVSQEIDEAQITYNKIQKILNCPEMIKSHAYLYALDMENVDECDRKKIDRLYDLGVARGVIDDKPEETPSDDTEDGIDSYGDEICGGPDDALTGQEMTPGQTTPAKTSSAYTVLYSAMKDGQVKTGEYFSSATDQDSAKTDCISNLAPLGYSNIRVLGIEQANDAVDFGNSTLDSLDEDDSKEYEAQETGDTSGEGQNSGEQGEEEPKNDENQDQGGQDQGGKEEQKQDDGAEQKNDENQDQGGKEEQKQDDGAEQKNDSGDGENNKSGEEDNKNDSEQSDGDKNGEGEQKKLTPTERGVLRDEYVGMFKAELQATKLGKSVNDMNNKEKADFWNKIVEKWKKQDPEEFMSPKEIEKLNDTVIKVG